MKRFFENMGRMFQTWMQGRYGTDELSYTLSMAGLVLMLLSCLIRPLGILYLPALAMLVWSLYRSLSRNIYKRQNERNKYLELRRGAGKKLALLKNMWRDRKTHRYYKCPYCKAIVRIPMPGRGKNIVVTCHRCHGHFNKRT